MLARLMKRGPRYSYSWVRMHSISINPGAWAHLSRNSWNRSASVSPVTSTTLGISVRGPFTLRPGALEPTTSSSGKPSPSLWAAALSEGGARGRTEEERICCERRGLPASLDGVGAASECRTASRRDDMAGGSVGGFAAVRAEAAEDLGGFALTRGLHRGRALR